MKLHSFPDALYIVHVTTDEAPTKGINTASITVDTDSFIEVEDFANYVLGQHLPNWYATSIEKVYRAYAKMMGGDNGERIDVMLSHFDGGGSFGTTVDWTEHGNKQLASIKAKKGNV